MVLKVWHWGVFSVFFTRSPSFLAHQTAMAAAKNKSHAQTLFGMQRISSDNHIRDLLDAVPPQQVFPKFGWVVSALNELGQLQAFRGVEGHLLIALDGTQYHHSSIVAPDQSHVLPLGLEFITRDGHFKQDCESAAAKHWTEQYATHYQDQALNVTLLGDDVCSRQPLCEQVIAAGLNFIFVCKLQSHPTLTDWLDDLEKAQMVQMLNIVRRKDSSNKLIHAIFQSTADM